MADDFDTTPNVSVANSKFEDLMGLVKGFKVPDEVYTLVKEAGLKAADAALDEVIANFSDDTKLTDVNTFVKQVVLIAAKQLHDYVGVHK